MTITPILDAYGHICWLAEIRHDNKCFFAYGDSNVEAFRKCVRSLGDYLRKQRVRE